MTKFELVKKYFDFPFDPHDFQEEAFEKMAEMDCSLLAFRVGYGKTFTSIISALYYSIVCDIEQILILCPPVLLDQWYEFLSEIKGIPSVCVYRGTPEERKKMDIENESIVLASFNIFRGKRDYRRFLRISKKLKLCIIGDELSLKSLTGSTYRKLKEVVYRKMRIKPGDTPYHKLIALNATPISDFDHVYNWCSIFLPGTYGSKKLFRGAHVIKEDAWGNVEEWKDVDVLSDHMNSFTVNTKKKIKLPPLVETIIPFTLTKKHYKLYEDVKKGMLADLPEDKIHLAVKALFSTLQRLVLVPREFGLDIDSPVLEIIDSYLSQMQEDEGVILYTRHVKVSKLLEVTVPDSVAYYGAVSNDQKRETLSKIKAGECKRLVGNLDSLGVGLNLHMLNHMLCVELPFRDDKLIQITGRIHRQKQKLTCFANYLIAKNTVQEKIFHRLLKNGEDLEKVIKTRDQAREFLS